MASGVYTLLKADLFRGVHDFDAPDDIIAALMNSSHSFTATNDAWADVSANEISGTGYSSPGLSLTGETVTTDDGNTRGEFDANDAEWTSATFSAYHNVVYNGTPTSPTADPLMCSFDFGGVQTVTSGRSH